VYFGVVHEKPGQSRQGNTYQKVLKSSTSRTCRWPEGVLSPVMLYEHETWQEIGVHMSERRLVKCPSSAHSGPFQTALGIVD
jgi:hypothetical protein